MALRVANPHEPKGFKMFTMTLSSIGNPDLAQYTPISDPESIETGNLEGIVAAAEEYIALWNLGAGNWPVPMVNEDTIPYGSLAFNMRITGTKDL
jgi:hypothetical protein